MNIPETHFPRIVIAGGGFGGLSVADALKDAPVQVVLIDRNNYHTFQPLLYQVASAGLEADSIAFPIRKIFKNRKNVFFRMAEILEVVTESKMLVTNIGSIHYDYLVLATGSQTGFFGLTNVKQLAMPMKSIPQALDLRSLMLQNFEKALLTTKFEERERLMNIVIVGGGPTGVEMAGALAELKLHILPQDYPDLDIRQMQIHLIEAAPRLLVSMSESSSTSAYKFLAKLGVNLWLNTTVENYDGQEVKTNKTRKLSTATLIWAAGVEGSAPFGIKAEAIMKNKRIIVDEFNRVSGHENIFAIGDVAAMKQKNYPNGHPMLAPVAMQQGALLAENILRTLQGKELKPFRYRDKGTMATVGRNKAVVELPFLKIQGFLAWYIWMFVHLMSLVGWRNRLVTLVNWMWSYFNYDRGVRLIIRPFNRKIKVR